MASATGACSINDRSFSSLSRSSASAAHLAAASCASFCRTAAISGIVMGTPASGVSVMHATSQPMRPPTRRPPRRPATVATSRASPNPTAATAIGPPVCAGRDFNRHRPLGDCGCVYGTNRGVAAGIRDLAGNRFAGGIPQDDRPVFWGSATRSMSRWKKDWSSVVTMTSPERPSRWMGTAIPQKERLGYGSLEEVAHGRSAGLKRDGARQSPLRLGNRRQLGAVRLARVQKHPRGGSRRP